MPEPAPEPVALAAVGSVVLLASSAAGWFDVLVEYPTDQVRRHYGVLGLGRGSLHAYIGWGRLFEVATVLAAVGAVLAIGYAGVVVERARAAATVLVGCGAAALAALLGAWLTFEFADPPGTAIGASVRLEPGGFVALLAGAGILAGGALLRRSG
ncbi:MAG TPA: hypothetical protein VJ653_01475 [Acidimicrobiales bacterium]|nr:hypothetical protein [Acidimicrobiales bacterium]